ncbi:MAG: ABC transporter permease [Gemmatimonadales bacterium]|nr:ABC transporter permease [Gemmatimonadales bacterium]
MTPPRFRFPWRSSRQLASEVDEELQYHLDAVAEELIRSGVPPEEAQRRAIADFGDLEGTRRVCLNHDRAGERRIRWSDRISDAWRDLRLLTRSLARQPLVAATAVGTLALGVGAATALWTITRAILLNPLPLKNAHELVILRMEDKASQVNLYPSFRRVDSWSKTVRGLTGIETIGRRTGVLSSESGAEVVQLRRITERFFDFAGAPPLLGRGFTAADRIQGSPKVAMLSYAYWNRTFGGDHGVIGKIVRINDVPHEIVGVTPPVFDRDIGALRPSALWEPLPAAAAGEAGLPIGRLKPGITPALLTEELQRVDAGIVEPAAPSGKWIPAASSARALMSEGSAAILYPLLGAVALLLTIASANVAHILLGRATARRAETALRSALGASRRRLLFSGLAEALLVGAGGALLGLGLARVMLALLIHYRPPALRGLVAVQLDGWAMVTALGTGVFGAMLGGVLIAARSGRAAPWALLRSVRTSTGREANRLRFGLVVLETALSLTLLFGAGLLARTMLRLQREDTGVVAEEVVAIQLHFPEWRLPNAPAKRDFADRLQAQLRAMPGVSGVSLASGVPPQTGIMFGALEIEGRVLGDGAPSFFANSSVSPSYFAVAGLPLLRGPGFGPESADSGRSVTIINREFARQFWPNESPIGKRLRIAGDKWMEIVGVAADVPALGLAEPRGQLMLYHPIDYDRSAAMIVVRTSVPLATLGPAVRAVVGGLDREIPIVSMATVRALLDESVSTERFGFILIALFAGAAVVLSASGLFGVLSHAVAQRTQEIGIRVALGADPASVRWLVLRTGLVPVGVGIAIGVGLSWASSRLLSSLVFGVSPRDGITLAAAAGLFLSVAMVASYLPASRATRVPAMIALRAE